MAGIALGERVKSARLERGMTMAELASACGLTKGFISQVESGSSNPSLNTLRRISEALQMSVSGLLTSTGSPARLTSLPARQEYPAILHDSYMAPAHAGIQCLAAGSAGVHALVTLAAGDRVSLTGSTTSQESSAEVVVNVLDGRAALTQHEATVRVSRGEIASLEAESDYAIEGLGAAGVRLLLFVPQGSSLPEYEPARAVRRVTRGASALSLAPIVLGVKRDRRRADRVAIPRAYAGSGSLSRARSDGPLRLVAMRAQRLAERGRRS